MSILKKCYIWLLISCKRLLHKWAFVIILCIIPIVLPLTEMAMQQQSNIMKIGICTNSDNTNAKEIVKQFVEKGGLISYIAYEDEKSARRAVENFDIDVAWVFVDDYQEKISGFVTGKKNKEPKSVIVYQREDSIVHKLAREVLFGAVYGDISFEVYKDFVSTELVTDRQLTGDEIEYYYDNLDWNEQDEMGIINLKTFNEPVSSQQTNFLTSPLRGIMSLMILLCTLTAAVYYLKDKNDKKYDWLPGNKRIIPAFGLCLCAGFFSALFAVISLFLSSIWTNTANEILSMIIFIFCATSFCVVLCSIIDSYGILGAIIPGIMIISLVLSPIFFNFNILKPVRLMLPTHYYLNSVYNSTYCLYGMLYCVFACVITYIINFIKNKN